MSLDEPTLEVCDYFGSTLKYGQGDIIGHLEEEIEKHEKESLAGKKYADHFRPDLEGIIEWLYNSCVFTRSLDIKEGPLWESCLDSVHCNCASFLDILKSVELGERKEIKHRKLAEKKKEIVLKEKLKFEAMEKFIKEKGFVYEG